ncbi:DUF2306 domain-containing protein [Fodinibacter luteus]|uniref:DUF2306 domain-containing protein n=1 Tax=Fodinibacter luteus TaxID=552064 RepID=A0ABP8KAU9_9MICO
MSARTATASAAGPAALVALAVVPLTAGALRLVEVAGGPELLPADERFTGFPTALVLHVVGSVVFALLGVAQLVPGVRRRHPAWHRRAGRVVAAAGLVVALSALWLTLAYTPRAGNGEVLQGLRVVFGSAMAVSIVLGFAAVRRRDIAAHRAWMLRAYALGLAAGTQVLTEPLGTALFGEAVVVSDLAKGAGWVVNLAVAEWVIRRSAGTHAAGAVGRGVRDRVVDPARPRGSVGAR